MLVRGSGPQTECVRGTKMIYFPDGPFRVENESTTTTMSGLGVQVVLVVR